ncbi:MAG TPA: hypothetical protein VNF47_09465 [Streptosporangiaceae bacterium]|nr:hypothetical protein [Streptosporangiaceae bacterium]
MPAELAAWLRQQRQARGWARPEMARQLIRAGQEAGDKSVPGLDSMCHNLYRWERGEDTPSERYQLHYCRALAIPPSQFGTAPPPPPGTLPPQRTATTESGSPAAALPAPAPHPAPNPAGPFLPLPAAIAYGGMQQPATDHSSIKQEVLMGAHEASDQAQQAEQHGIGQATSEQLRADVVRLSHLTDTGEPFTVYLDLRRVRERIYRLLERPLWPREQTDLHFLLGCLNGLMAVCARRLGYPDAAEELSRAGWAHASVIDHRPLLAHLRYQLSYVEYLRGRTIQSRDLAASGLEYLSAGPGGAELYLKHAQAAATLGDADTARQSVIAAHEARSQEHHDDLQDIGHSFTLSLATHHSDAGRALSAVPGAEGQAAEELQRAIGLYDAGPDPGEEHWFGGKALAGIDLAVVRLRSGALDAATAALGNVFSLAPAQRVSQLTHQLSLVRAELAAPVFRGSAPARELDEQIEEFGRETADAGLHSLSGGPG